MYNIYINNTIGFSENSAITYYNEVAKGKKWPCY